MKTSFLALALLAPAAIATAAVSESGRLVLDVKIDGTGQTRGAQGKADFKTAQSAHLAFTVHLVAGLEAINRLDEAGAQAAYAQQNAPVQARMPSEAEAQRMAAQMQKKAAACGNNVACLQRLGEEASRMSMAMTGTPAMPQVQAQEGRYLNFSGMRPEACRMEYSVRIQDSVTGAIDDVGGPKPYLEKRDADYQGNERDATFVCQSLATLDTKGGTLWVVTQPPAPKGKVTRHHGAERRSDAPVDGVQLHKEAMAWVFEQLRGKVPQSGSRKTSLRVPLELMGQKGEQQVEVDMRWKFETK